MSTLHDEFYKIRAIYSHETLGDLTREGYGTGYEARVFICKVGEYFPFCDTQVKLVDVTVWFFSDNY